MDRYSRLLLAHAKAKDLAGHLLDMGLMEDYAEVLAVADSLKVTRDALLPVLLPGAVNCPDCGTTAIMDAPGVFRCEPCGIGWCHAG